MFSGTLDAFGYGVGGVLMALMLGAFAVMVYYTGATWLLSAGRKASSHLAAEQGARFAVLLAIHDPEERAPSGVLTWLDVANHAAAFRRALAAQEQLKIQRATELSRTRK